MGGRSAYLMVISLALMVVCLTVSVYLCGRWTYRRKKDERDAAQFIGEVQLRQAGVEGVCVEQTQLRQRHTMPPGGLKVGTPNQTLCHGAQVSVQLTVAEVSSDDTAEMLSDIGNTTDCLSDSSQEEVPQKRAKRFRHKKNRTSMCAQFIEIEDLHDEEEEVV